jgi:hypothetical protein
MDNTAAIKILELLRSQAVLFADLDLDVRSLIDCLSLVPDFRKTFDDRRRKLEQETQKQRRAALESIDAKIQDLKKSNGGA